MAHAGATVFFITVTAWLTWPLFARMGTALSDSPDSLLNHWAMAWSLHILPRDPLSLFDANIFFPRKDTLAYSEHLFGVTLLAAPAYLASGSTVLAYNAALAASFVLSGLGMYLLIRELTGSLAGGLFGGLVYMAAPYRLLHILHIQLLSAQWFPFVLLYLYRYVRGGRRRHLMATSLFILLQALSCNYYAVYLALALAVFALVALVFSLEPPRVLTWRKTGGLLLASTVVSALFLPFALPYERNRQRGFYRRYEDVVQFSALPSDYLRPSSFNKVFYAKALPRQQRSEKALFPGAAALLLGLAGLLGGAGRREKHQRLMWWFFVLLIGVGFVLSVGPELRWGGATIALPYRALYRHVPGFRGMRVPARLSLLVLLGLAPLAGWGLERLLRPLGRYRPWCGGALVALALFDYQTFSLERALPEAPPVPAVYRWLAGQPDEFGIVELPLHEDIRREAIRMYYSTLHWKRLANGFSGWWPNDYWVLVGRMRYFPTAGTLRFLERDVPVRYIIIHTAEYPEAQRRHLERNLARYRDRLPLRARFGTDVVHELTREAHAPAARPSRP